MVSCALNHSLQEISAIWTQLQQRFLIFLITYQNKPERELDASKILESFWEFFRNSLGILYGVALLNMEFFENSLWNSLGVLCDTFIIFENQCRELHDTANYQVSIFSVQLHFPTIGPPLILKSLRGVSSVPFPFQFPFQLHCKLVSSGIIPPISSKYSELVSSDVILLNLKRDRTIIGLSF